MAGAHLAVAQLPTGAEAPAGDGSILVPHAGVGAGERDLGHVGELSDRPRTGPEVPVATVLGVLGIVLLADGQAPARQLPVAVASTGAIVAERHRGHVLQRRNLDRLELGIFDDPTPTVNLALGGLRTAVLSRHPHLDDASDVRHGGGQRVVPARSVSQSAAEAAPPAPSQPVGVDGAGVVLAGGDLPDVLQQRDLLGPDLTLGLLAEAQRRVRVVPPGLDGAIAVQGEGVIAAEHQRGHGIRRHGLASWRHRGCRRSGSCRRGSSRGSGRRGRRRGHATARRRVITARGNAQSAGTDQQRWE
jgi:hypothetical protein